MLFYVRLSQAGKEFIHILIRHIRLPSAIKSEDYSSRQLMSMSEIWPGADGGEKWPH